MDMQSLEHDWEMDVYSDDPPIDWGGFPAEQAIKFPGKRLGLFEEISASAGDSHIGFAVDSIALEDDPE